MSTLTIPNSFNNGTAAVATEVNANFNAVKSIVEATTAGSNIDTDFRLMAWNSPFLSTLSGTDKDALQSIFSSLRAELERLQLEIDDLKNKPANKFKEQTRY